MVDKLFEIGIKQGMGIFFFLFVVVAAAFWLFIRSVMRENNGREKRYIDTIDKLATSLGNSDKTHQVLEKIDDALERQESMLGRVLDRLPVKGA